MVVSSEVQTAKVRVKIEGRPPGLIFQGRGLMALEQSDSKKKPPKTPEDEAQYRAHWKGSGRKRELAIPSVMFYNSFCQAGMAFKQPHNKRLNMSFMIAPTVAFEEDMIGLGTSTFETLVEWVRIPPRTGAMVQIGRPIMRKWSVEFMMMVDDEQWDVNLLSEIIIHAGKNVGIGAWRAGLKGPYGKYLLKEFEVKR